MNLTEKPEFVQWPVTHYVFIEKIGPFQETAQAAWGALHANLAAIQKTCKKVGMMALYQIEPEMIYRAGMIADQKPSEIPPGFQYVKFEGGKYSKFTLTGGYENLPEACGRVFEIVEETGLEVRDGAFYIEHYLNDLAVTASENLKTEILIPTA